MKKSILTLLVAVMGLSAAAQDTQRAMHKGKVSVNLYYGYSLSANIWKGLLKGSEVKVSAIGPVGLMAEYMVTDGIGLGAEANYSALNFSYFSESTNSSGNVERYKYELNITNIRALFRANFHFTKDENFDAYVLMGAGIRNNSWTVRSTDPSFQTSSYTFPFNVAPFGAKVGMGFRYFFTPNFGANMELAIGAPVMSAGLSFKF